LDWLYREDSTDVEVIFMLLRISGQNVRISGEIKTYVTTKASNLAKYHPHLDRVRVTLRRGPNGVAIARIIASGKKRRCFVAEETADNAYGSINRATRDLERQLSEANRKRRNRRHHPKPAVAYQMVID
jgi:ribosomal subunit interface protein